MGRFRVINKNLGSGKADIVLSIIMLILVFTATLISCSFSITTKKLVDLNVNYNINARTLFVERDIQRANSDYGVFDNHKNIITTYPRSARFYHSDIKIPYKNKVHDTNIVIYGANERTLPSITEGRELDFKSNGEIILPEVIMADKSGIVIKGKDLIGKNLEVYVEEYDFSESIDNPKVEPKIVEVHKKDFKVVGTYDSDKIATWDNQFYATYDDVEMLNRISEGNLREFHHETILLMAVVDNYDNVHKVMSDLKSKGFNSNLAYQLDTPFITLIISFSSILTIAVIVFGIIMLSSIQNKNINKRTVDIGLMKALGYKDKSIAKMILLQVEVISIAAFLVALVISYYIANALSPIIFENEIEMSILGSGLIINLVIAICIPLLSILISLRKILNISPVVAMKEVE